MPLHGSEPPQEYSFFKSNATQKGAKALEILPAVTNEVLKACLSTEVCTLLPLQFSIFSATELVMFWILLSRVCCSSQRVT